MSNKTKNTMLRLGILYGPSNAFAPYQAIRGYPILYLVDYTKDLDKGQLPNELLIIPFA